MRIAVTYEDGGIFQHFGHTSQFKLYDVEDGKVVRAAVVDTNGSGHGALATFLQAFQVDALICGGIGGGAINALTNAGIDLYPGIDGSADMAVMQLIAGVLPKRSMGYKIRQRIYKCLRVLGTHPLTKPLFGELYETQRDKRSSADYKAASPVMRKTLSNVVNTDMTPFMPQIKVPVLLVWGEKDTATPLSDGQTMEKLIPGSGLAVIQGGSHFPFVENPRQFAGVMSAFLLN